MRVWGRGGEQFEQQALSLREQGVNLDLGEQRPPNNFVKLDDYPKNGSWLMKSVKCHYGVLV